MLSKTVLRLESTTLLVERRGSRKNEVQTIPLHDDLALTISPSTTARGLDARMVFVGPKNAYDSVSINNSGELERYISTSSDN